jgi:hypothetical protein
LDDLALSTDVRLRVPLKALKYSRRGDLPARFEIVLDEAHMLHWDALYAVLTYLDKSPIELDRNLIHETLQRLVPERKEQIMGWFSQPYYDEGLAEGEARGETRGEAKGKAKLLTRFLERRFGDVPSYVRERISAANVESIDVWVERAFDAPDLHSIFNSN